MGKLNPKLLNDLSVAHLGRGSRSHDSQFCALPFSLVRPEVKGYIYQFNIPRHKDHENKVHCNHEREVLTSSNPHTSFYILAFQKHIPGANYSLDSWWNKVDEPPQTCTPQRIICPPVLIAQHLQKTDSSLRDTMGIWDIHSRGKEGFVLTSQLWDYITVPASYSICNG